jgi:hypothetical protein
MTSAAPVIKEELEEDDPDEPAGSEADEKARDDEGEKSLDDIIDAYAR